MKVRIERVTAPLRTGLQTAHGRIEGRQLLLLSLEDEDGQMGWGEAGPLESYDGVSVEDAQAALEDCRTLLGRADGVDHETVVAQCRDVAVLPQAVAAVDLALWDLAGRRAGAPVWQLLGAPGPGAPEVNHTLVASDRAGAAQEAAQASQAGFRCLKVKVGIGDDAGRLAAVRSASGPGMALRLDANGAWSVTEAQAALRSLEPVGIELCEEPVRGLSEMEQLAQLTQVPLALDESAWIPGALDRRVCAAVGLKISRCGGISGLIEAATRARAAGYEVYLSSTLDGPLAVAAAVHAAALLVPERPSGLATLGLFAGRGDPLPPHGGRIPLPGGAGLGDGLLGWYET